MQRKRTAGTPKNRGAAADPPKAKVTATRPFFVRPEKIPEDGPEYEAMVDAMTDALCDWLDGK